MALLAWLQSVVRPAQSSEKPWRSRSCRQSPEGPHAEAGDVDPLHMGTPACPECLELSLLADYSSNLSRRRAHVALPPISPRSVRLLPQTSDIRNAGARRGKALTQPSS